MTVRSKPFFTGDVLGTGLFVTVYTVPAGYTAVLKDLRYLHAPLVGSPAVTWRWRSALLQAGLIDSVSQGAVMRVVPGVWCAAIAGATLQVQVGVGSSIVGVLASGMLMHGLPT